MRMVSPQEVYDASKEYMLEGREPKDFEDWEMLANFWAANMTIFEAVNLIALLFHCPIPEGELKRIFVFQRARNN